MDKQKLEQDLRMIYNLSETGVSRDQVIRLMDKRLMSDNIKVETSEIVKLVDGNLNYLQVKDNIKRFVDGS